jgi:hypothetical protein
LLICETSSARVFDAVAMAELAENTMEHVLSIAAARQLIFALLALADLL